MGGKKLPKGWILATIGDVTLPVAKIDPKKSANRIIQYVDIASINNKRNRIEAPSFLRLSEAPSRARQVVKEGDVLFSMVRPYLKNIARVPMELDGEIASTGFCVLRSNGAIDPRLLFYKAVSQEFIDSLSRSQYGVAYPAVNASQVRAQLIDLPPLKEQRRIVEKIETLFTELDEGEESLRKVQTLLARYRQSVLKAAVTGELTADWRTERAGQLEHGRDLLARILKARRENWQGRGKYREPVEPDTSNLPELPDGWVWATVDQVTSSFRNGLSKRPTSTPNSFPILRISATRSMSVDVTDIRYYPAKDASEVESYWVEKGDLFFTRYNGSAHLVGVCGQMRAHTPVLYPDKLIRVRPVGMGVDTDFLELAWNAGETRRYIASRIKTTSGQQGIAGADIKAAPFPLPPVEEQKVVAARAWEAFERASDLEGSCEFGLRRSSALRQAILRDAFSGKIVPQDPNDEPASELLARIRAQRAAQPPKASRRTATA